MVDTLNMNDPCSLLALLKQLQERPENSGINRDSNPDPFDASAVLYQLSYQANWRLVTM